ncbi:DUF6438 domain-containing protein [Flavobacterium alkalisoli]|uniref:DUF6438 domain-containing protein n=1 Tax=Flavobacterium alkalisoli TaxID=2602769 RepID=UPI003A94832A
MKYALLFLFSFLFISCQKDKPLTPQEKILGVWSAVDTTTSIYYRYQYGDSRGFEFFQDNIFEDKFGFHSDERYLRDTVNDDYYVRDRYYSYFGTMSKYNLSNDSLKLFNPATEEWDMYKIEKFTPDTLIIVTDTKHKRGGTFVKKNYRLDTIPDFDALFFSSSPCLGSCPTINLFITKNGDVWYNGEHDVKNKGLYKSKISKEKFERIQENFKRSNYMNLKESYFAMSADLQTVFIYFIKDDKIIKTIEDHGDGSPNEFVWAYYPLEFIDQELVLKPVQIPENVAKEFNIDPNNGDITLFLYHRRAFELLKLLSDTENFKN